ncbi:MAG: hypothetical protein AAF561_16380 [Planctomycetota bacterium]
MTARCPTWQQLAASSAIEDHATARPSHAFTSTRHHTAMEQIVSNPILRPLARVALPGRRVAKGIWAGVQRADASYDAFRHGRARVAIRWLLLPLAFLVGLFLLRQGNVTLSGTHDLTAPLMCVAAAMTFALTAIGFVASAADGHEMP